MHSFMHHIQLPIALTWSASIVPCLPQLAYYPSTLMTFTNNSVPLNKVSPPLSTNPLSYDNVPQSPKALAGDHRVQLVKQWLSNFKRPPGLNNKAIATFICYATSFFLADGKLWQCNCNGEHKLFILTDSWLCILHAMHENLGHCGLFATWAALLECFWWPQVAADHCLVYSLMLYLLGSPNNQSLDTTHHCYTSSLGQ